MKPPKCVYSNTNFENELDNFMKDMRSVTKDNIDKISIDAIHKHRAMVFWFAKEYDVLLGIIASICDINSDYDDSNDFI